MKQEIPFLQDTFLDEIKRASSLDELEAIRLRGLGKSGSITELMKSLKHFSGDEKKEKGALYNNLRTTIQEALSTKKQELLEKQATDAIEQDKVDVTLDERVQNKGSIHPITQVTWELTNILKSLGFVSCHGPHIEDDFHNFDALNIPPDHPARQEHDTFYISQGDNKEKLVLRTHTSNTQIRVMEEHIPPFKFIATGRVFRADYDATHTPTFHQLEGVYVDQDVHMGHLKWCLQELLCRYFEVDEVSLRLRPSDFPFTEPSIEVDIGYHLDKNGEMRFGGTDNWLEILGAGMIHPNVLENCKIDHKKYQGFAFGLGVERLAMLKYGMSDLRAFYEGDIRWLKHYGFSFCQSL